MVVSLRKAIKMRVPRNAGRILPALLLMNFFLLFPAAADGQGLSKDDALWSDKIEDDFFYIDDGKSITVVGTIETSQQMDVIEKGEIEKHNAPDLAVLLQESLNIGFTRYGGRGNMGNVNLRGFDSKRVAVLVDGVPINSVMDGKIDIDKIDINSIERIEVIYGGSDTKYNVSGALGGVINIVTIKKQKPGFKIGASVSNTSVPSGKYRDRNGKTKEAHWEDLADTQNYSLDAAYGGDKFSVAANAFANRAANHFLFTDSIGYVRRKDNNEVWDTGAGASFIWEFPSYTKLITSSNFYYGDKNIPTSGFSSILGSQQDTSTRHSLMLDAPRAFHDTLATEASLAYDFTRRSYVSPADVESVQNQNNIMAVNRWSWYPGQKLTLRSGLDYRFIYLDSTEIGEHSRHDGGVYLTAEYKPFSSFLIIPSIKAVAASGGKGGVIPVPKLGFLFSVSDSIIIRNNYFRSFKFPDFEELYWSGGREHGNPNLQPEDGWGGDFGISWSFKELFTLDSTFFTQWLKDSIHWYSSGNNIWQPENVGEAIYFGLDSKLKFEIPISQGSIKKLVPSVSYQFLYSYLLSFGYNFSSNKRIPYMPMHTIGASLEVPWETGSIIISAHFESLRYVDRANISTLKPHFLLNMTFNQKMGKHFSFFSSLRNILNQSYESFAEYPMPGISLTLGLRTEFKTKEKQNE